MDCVALRYRVFLVIPVTQQKGRSPVQQFPVGYFFCTSSTACLFRVLQSGNPSRGLGVGSGQAQVSLGGARIVWYKVKYSTIQHSACVAVRCVRYVPLRLTMVRTSTVRVI